MANTPDLTPCRADALTSTPLPIDPWRSLAVHFGMLLGVDDFRIIDAYHRGKQWLHTGWLHREGVIWGFEASLADGDGESSELRLEPGLAIDPAGRELHLERPACIDLGKWFGKRAEQLFADGELEPEADGSVRLDAHVRVRFVSCLDRPVPAMVEPCEGSGRTTAYSRVYETVELELVPGLPETDPPPLYHRLRLLAGIDQPRTDAGGQPIPEDLAIAQTRADILALPFEAQPAAFEAAFRECAALDAAELAPADDQAGARGSGAGLLPALDPAWLVLATLRGLVLRPDDNGSTGSTDGQTPWIFVELDELDWRSRPTHVATRPLQDIVAAALACSCTATAGPPPDPEPPARSGPRVLRAGSGIDGRSLSLRFDQPLLPTSERGQLELFAFVSGRGWNPVPVGELILAGDGLSLQTPMPTLPRGSQWLRLCFGRQEPPVLGVDGLPLAGADDDGPILDPLAGRPFLTTFAPGSAQ